MGDAVSSWELPPCIWYERKFDFALAMTQDLAHPRMQSATNVHISCPAKNFQILIPLTIWSYFALRCIMEVASMFIWWYLHWTIDRTPLQQLRSQRFLAKVQRCTTFASPFPTASWCFLGELSVELLQVCVCVSFCSPYDFELLAFVGQWAWVGPVIY